jgi:hypothetical protein
MLHTSPYLLNRTQPAEKQAELNDMTDAFLFSAFALFYALKKRAANIQTFNLKPKT